MKKIINFRPLIYFALSLCSGIVAAYAFVLGKIVLGVVSVAVFIGICTALCLFYRGDGERKAVAKRKKIYIAVAVLLSAIGALNTTIAITDYDNADLGTKTFNITAKITEIKPVDGGYATLLSDVNVKGSASGKTDYKISLYVFGECDYDIGDIIEFKSKLFDRESVYENKFSAHYVAEGIKYTATVSPSDVTVVSRLRTLFEHANVFVRDALKAGLSQDAYAVSYALLCGNSEYMDTETISNFRAAGVAHIFAVSGLHIGFLATFLGFITDKLKFGKYCKFCFIVGALVMYSGVCGFTASAVRATVMAAVLLFAETLGKKYDGLSAVSVAAICILIFAPLQLFCAGFRLSFGVVIGISVLSRPIAGFFRFLPEKISKSLGVVFAAQIAGIPISLAVFGEFSFIAVIANLIFIPFVGVMYVFLLIATLLGGFFGISAITLFIPNLLLKFITMLITTFDFGVFMVGGISFGVFTVFYGLAFTAWSDRLNLSILARGVVSAVSAAIFAFGVILANVADYRAVKLVAIGSEDVCATVISSGDDAALIINGADAYFSVYRIKRALDRVKARNIDAVIIADSVNGIDAQAVMTRLYSVSEITDCYYYGAGDNVLQTTLEKSFKSTRFTAVDDGDVCVFGRFYVTMELNGYCAVVYTEKSAVYLFSEFGSESAGYIGLEKGPYLIAAADYAENICYEYSPKIMLGYRNGVFANAEKSGNYSVKI